MYEPPYELTKIDIAALRQADYLMIGTHGASNYSRQTKPDPVFRAGKRFPKSEKNPYEHDVQHSVPAPIRCKYNYKTPDSEYHCAEYLSLFPDQKCDTSSILATLRAGDAIAIEFYPDHGTHDDLREGGFHCDAVQLLVYRKGSLHATFMLASRVNRSRYRMCREYPKSIEYSLVT